MALTWNCKEETSLGQHCSFSAKIVRIKNNPQKSYRDIKSAALNLTEKLMIEERFLYFFDASAILAEHSRSLVT